MAASLLIECRGSTEEDLQVKHRAQAEAVPPLSSRLAGKTEAWGQGR